MYGMSITVDDRQVRQLLRNLEVSLADENVGKVIGRTARNTIKQHLVDYDDAKANKLGGRRTHFYANAARKVEYRTIAGGVEIGIDHTGIAQRFFGGTIKPVNSKLLTIPANPDAYGRRAGEFNNLELVGSRKNGFLALVERQSDAIALGPKRKDGSRGIKRGKKLGGRIMFWLVPEAKQKADPNVLPPESKLYRDVRSALVVYLQGLKGDRP
jgi:hypothetical protein